MDNISYISDQFEIWNTCEKKYYYKYFKQLRLPEDKNNFYFGTSVHALVQYYLNGHNIEHLEATLDDEVRTHWFSIKNSAIIKNKPFLVEWSFNSLITGSEKWINGRVDTVFYDEKNKKYIIVDWKTGQNIPKIPEDGFQCKMYLYSFYKAQKDLNIDISYEDVCFQYVKTPNLECSEPVIYSEEKEQKYLDEFKNIISSIENTNHYKHTENIKNCNFCAYRSLCKKQS